MIVFGFATGAPWLMGTDGGGPGGISETLAPVVFQLSFGAFVAVLCVVGIWASGEAERSFGRKDDGRIVIDEVVGQLIALAPLLAYLGPGSSFFSLAIGVVTGFVLFRLFDVWKPGAVRWAERHFDGGLGVMADDLVAGAYAAGALVVLVSAADVVSPGFLLSSGGLSMASGGLLTAGGGLLTVGGGLLTVGGGLSMAGGRLS
jgi:phosphatidylglycerophosphatase A